MAKHLKGGFSGWLRAILFALAILLLLRFFCFQFFMIGNSGMEKALMPGDIVLVNKLSIGSRLPVTPLSLPFFPEIYSDFIELPYWRIVGYSKPELYDVLAFNYPAPSDLPIDKKPMYFKRLVALPGDTLLIDRSKVKVNGSFLPELKYFQHNYRFTVSGGKLPEELMKKNNFSEGGLIDPSGVYEFPLTAQMAKELGKEKSLIGFRKMIEFENFAQFGIYPDNPYFTWNRDNYGHVLIPAKGTKVELTNKNFIFYRKLIEIYEKNEVELRNDKIYINGEIKSSYTFQMNYYFVMDDNRHGAKDSRFWGLLPEDHLVGKVNFVFMSITPQGRASQWNRFFRTVK